MKVFKFGGASVRDAAGVRNLAAIVAAEQGALFVVVSAMGKTTNALERVLDQFWEGKTAAALAGLAEVKEGHEEICRGLFEKNARPETACGALPQRTAAFFDELDSTLRAGRGEVSDNAAASTYDYWYDRLVSYGELISTSIVAAFLGARWIDARTCFATDGRHRDANVDLDETTRRLSAALAGTENTETLQRGETVQTDNAARGTHTAHQSANGLRPDTQSVVTQGFIGANAKGDTTTLGREGSDYSAAVMAYITNAESLTIWKDVPGVMNADPKLFPDAIFIPELSYLDAVELAYSGAQIIHPKTIKPLQNRGIPLFVRPFGAPQSPGTKIWEHAPRPVSVPVLILKRNQTLLTIRPRDFSFVLEQRLHEIFVLLNAHGLKPNLIQSSAISLSMCVDESRNLPHVVGRLTEEGFNVVWNGGMELLTIRGYTPELLARHEQRAFLLQKTRRTLRIVRKSQELD